MTTNFDKYKCLINSLVQKEQSAHHLSPWVFSQEGTKEPIHPQSPTRYFTKFGERHNVPNFHPHLLRHTSASVAITHGADVVSVSQRLGHSDTAVTLRMYSHANEESIRAAGQIARDAVKQATQTKGLSQKAASKKVKNNGSRPLKKGRLSA